MTSPYNFCDTKHANSPGGTCHGTYPATPVFCGYVRTYPANPGGGNCACQGQVTVVACANAGQLATSFSGGTCVP